MGFRYKKKATAKAKKTPGESYEPSGTRPPLGSGGRFAALESNLGEKGASNPGALAAYIGRKKYGAKKMGKLAAGGKK